ncbi:ABC transporter ATP-binding protein [Funiculus sociatus GB2-A5]|uniref:ABC transporter ATP-binding protein n=1 Tax=Funiculus sociatus GB2-A5 TaxID=2933946 RepID=A0ABV0JQN3_9CYAN|nr:MULTISPECIES: ABC transporter ATP-binding protein [unclassified Trichocoleus]MBD1906676.1 ABC transporter ATP-binding protein [Trichocoleus sp. FACHB-832]MBD2063113.1 ABC transporter ATP-binding protein [Trichocoleus sp. FACHB-6]
MEPIISVRELGKMYRIRSQDKKPYRTLREELVEGVQKLWQGKFAQPKMEEFWALKDINFDIYPGEVVGIIGRNGAGKSTLLKILSRITPPTTGEAILRGRVGSLLEVGTGFHPELTGRENIYLSGAILGMSRAEIKKKFDEIVAFAEVEKFIDTPVKRYSSGMYVRLAFGVAAHLEPEILVVDEVLAVGDAQFQKKCLGKMQDVSREGRTVLFVSHNMPVIRKLCKSSILLNQGQIEIISNTETVLRKYLEGGENSQAIYPIQHPKNGSTPGYAHKLIIEDESGNPATTIPIGQPWQIRVYFTINEKIEHFIIALGFRTSDEIPLRTCWSKPWSLVPGEYQAVFREETVILGAGRYSIIVGLSSRNQSFHYVENTGVLEIAEYTDKIELLKNSNVGIILNSLNIDIYNTINVK